MLSVPVTWVREATRANQLPTVTLGRYRRYRREAILEWVANHENGGGPRRSRKHSPVASDRERA